MMSYAMNTFTAAFPSYGTCFVVCAVSFLTLCTLTMTTVMIINSFFFLQEGL